MVFRFGSVLTAVLILALLALPAAADIACGGEGKSVPDSHGALLSFRRALPTKKMRRLHMSPSANETEAA